MIDFAFACYIATNDDFNILFKFLDLLKKSWIIVYYKGLFRETKN